MVNLHQPSLNGNGKAHTSVSKSKYQVGTWITIVDEPGTWYIFAQTPNGLIRARSVAGRSIVTGDEEATPTTAPADAGEAVTPELPNVVPLPKSEPSYSFVIGDRVRIRKSNIDGWIRKIQGNRFAVSNRNSPHDEHCSPNELELIERAPPPEPKLSPDDVETKRGKHIAVGDDVVVDQCAEWDRHIASVLSVRKNGELELSSEDNGVIRSHVSRVALVVGSKNSPTCLPRGLKRNHPNDRCHPRQPFGHSPRITMTCWRGWDWRWDRS